jgi:hypothetical protein
MKIIGKRDPLRVAIGEATNRRSNLWRVAVRKSDIYVSTGGAAPAKFSFHESGICRDAFTSQFGVPPGMQDRVITRWQRGEIRPPNSNRACSVLEIIIPTDFLSVGLDVPPKQISWVDTAPVGRSTSIEMFFSADAPPVVESLLQQHGARKPIAGLRLDNGFWFYLTSHEIAFAGQTMRIPATGNRKFDFLITRETIPSSTRSTRILQMNTPGDGDKMVAWEYGAYRCGPGEHHQVDGTLTPEKIYAATSWNS